MHFSSFFLSSFKVLIVTAPGKENFYVNSWRGDRCFDRLAIKTDHQCQLRGSNPRPHPYHGCALPTAPNRQKCATKAHKKAHMAVHLWLSHRLSMLVIIVYHTSCRCARENLKIFRFSKGKRGLGAKTPFSVFWRRPKHKKDKKKAFRRFFFFFIFIRRSRW